MNKNIVFFTILLSLTGNAASRITAPVDPAKRCMNEPMPVDYCENMRVKAVQLGCISEEEAADLRKYGSYPTCNILKPKTGEPPSQMLDGWCACGCFAPWTRIAVTNIFDTSLENIFEVKASQISVNKSLNLVNLTEDATLSNMDKTQSKIRITTQGEENKGLIKILTKNGKSLYLTEKHPVLTSKGMMVLASQLRPTDQLVTENGDAIQIISLSSVPYKGLVYNFVTESESKNEHVIFANGFAVGDLFWQASLEDEMNQTFIRK